LLSPIGGRMNKMKTSHDLKTAAPLKTSDCGNSLNPEFVWSEMNQQVFG
jgi:hypothetical protein